MRVDFYQYTGDFRKCDKSEGLTLLLTYNATYLKEPESIRSINLRIQYANQEDKAKLLKSNYCYIHDLDRYYEVRPESVLELGGILIMALEEDDIMSNLEDVLALECVIKRQEKRYNTYLNDEKFKAYEYTGIETIPFPNGFTSQSYILTIAGGGN